MVRVSIHEHANGARVAAQRGGAESKKLARCRLEIRRVELFDERIDRPPSGCRRTRRKCVKKGFQRMPGDRTARLRPELLARLIPKSLHIDQPSIDELELCLTDQVAQAAPGQLARVLVRSRGLLEQFRQLNGAAGVLDERLNRNRQSRQPLQFEGQCLVQRLGAERRHDLKRRDCPVSADCVKRAEAVGFELDDVERGRERCIRQRRELEHGQAQHRRQLGMRAALGFGAAFSSHRTIARDRLDPGWSSGFLCRGTLQ